MMMPSRNPEITFLSPKSHKNAAYVPNFSIPSHMQRTSKGNPVVHLYRTKNSDKKFPFMYKMLSRVAVQG